MHRLKHKFKGKQPKTAADRAGTTDEHITEGVASVSLADNDGEHPILGPNIGGSIGEVVENEESRSVEQDGTSLISFIISFTVWSSVNGGCFATHSCSVQSHSKH